MEIQDTYVRLDRSIADLLEVLDKKVGLQNVLIFVTSTFATLGYASEVVLQKDKSGIADDAVSAVTAKATIYMPFAELVDLDKEIERLTKEEEKLKKELARSEGMLSNEKFVSRAPEAKIAEEREKLEKYRQMMAQVQERLAQLRK